MSPERQQKYINTNNLDCSLQQLLINQNNLHRRIRIVKKKQKNQPIHIYIVQVRLNLFRTKWRQRCWSSSPRHSLCCPLVPRPPGLSESSGRCPAAPDLCLGAPPSTRPRALAAGPWLKGENTHHIFNCHTYYLCHYWMGLFVQLVSWILFLFVFTLDRNYFFMSYVVLRRILVAYHLLKMCSGRGSVPR